MTIINPNSISGISSITALNSTAAINLFKDDGTSANVIAGVVTATTFKAGGIVRIANTNFNAAGNADELVIGTTDGNRGLTIVSGNTGIGALFFADDGQTNIGSLVYEHNTNQMRMNVAGQQVMRLDYDTSSIPKWIIGNDLDTHISLPSANTFAFTTGGNERLRITSDGKIGIGEDDPDDNFLLIRAASTVGTNKGHIMLTGDSATVGQGPQIVFSESGSGSSFAGAYVGHIREGTNSTGALVFGTRETGGDANTVPTERLRIGSNGNITFTGPSNSFATIQYASNFTKLDLRGNGIANSYHYILSYGAGHGSADDFHMVNKTTNGGLVFRTGSSATERLRIDSSGKLGLGMSSDQKTGGLKGKLDIDASGINAAGDTDDTNDYAIVIRNPSTTDSGNGIAFTNDGGTHVGGAIIHIDKGSNNIGDLAFFTSATTNNPTERVRITSGGVLTTNQCPALDTTAGSINITGGTSGGRIAIQGTSTSAGAGLAELFGFWGTNKVAGMIVLSGADTSNKDDGHLTFYTRPDTATGVQERLRITSGDCTSFGNSSPPAWQTGGGYYNLQLGNATYFRADTDASTNFLSFGLNAYRDSSGWKFVENGKATQVSHQDGNIIFNVSNSGGAGNAITFSEALRIASGGNVTVAAGSLIAQNSGAGSGTSQLQLQPYGTQGYFNFTGSSHLYLRMGSSYSQKFIFRNTGDLEITDGNLMVASGHGIDFSATADSGGTKENELLDDYEEGTFTPTFYYVSGTSGVSYSTQEGRYTKIGRLVSIQIKMSVSNIGSGNNNMRVGGLPFAPVGSGVSYDYFNFSAIVGMNIGSGRVPFAQLEDYGGGGRITMYSFDYSSSSSYAEINSSHLSNGLNFGMTGTYVTS